MWQNLWQPNHTDVKEDFSGQVMLKMGPKGKKRSNANEEKKEEALSKGTALSTELP